MRRYMPFDRSCLFCCGVMASLGVSIRTGKRSFWSQEWVIRSVTVVGFLIIFVAMQFWLTQGFFVAGSRVLNIHQNVPVLLLATAAVVGLLGHRHGLTLSSQLTAAIIVDWLYASMRSFTRRAQPASGSI